MEFPKLSDEQKGVARMIADTARSYGVDPELALAVGWTENKFKSAGTSSAGALGPMQVMPANAKALGLKPDDLLDPQTNIEAGMRILKENLQAHEGNPKYALVGYNASPRTAKRFAEHNDINRLPQETQDYLLRVGSMRDINQHGLLPEEASKAPQASDLSYLGALPPDIDQAAPEQSTMSQMYEGARNVLSGPSGEIDKPLLTGAGAVAGAGLGVAQTGVGFGQKVLQALERSANAGNPEMQVPDSNAPGQKYKAKTGYGKGAGYTVEDVVTARERAKGHGKISSKLTSLYGVPEAGESTLDILLRKQKVEQQLAKEASRAKVLNRMGMISKLPIIGPALAGGSAGYDIADAIDRYEKGDISGSVLQGMGALGSAAALVPHPLTKAIGTGVGLGAIPAVMLNDYLKGRE